MNMKSRLTLIATAVLALFISQMTSAQDYRPKTTWPYMFEEFISAEVTTPKGEKISVEKGNVCIADWSLHYDDNGTIKKSDMSRVSRVVIGDKELVVLAGGRLYIVVGTCDSGMVLEQTAVDEEAMSKTKIGYGIASSTAQSMANVSVLMEMSADILNMDTLGATERKADGEPLPLKSVKYLYFRNLLIPAKDGDVVRMTGVDKKVLQSFVKTEKLKWRDVDDLQKILGFIDEKVAK